ncbi:hypothetical protein ABT039_22935 [Streptomyces lasiicapitis]|uniref:hypothetical protein n=1 Tax=Streptomyces lasiicapitis TaxID=1923961 RepID=UPI003329EED6
MATKTKNQRNAEREQIGQHLEAELNEIRRAWLPKLAKLVKQQERELLEMLGVSAKWKQEKVAKLRAQAAATGGMDAIIIYEQAAFVESLTVTE